MEPITPKRVTMRLIAEKIGVTTTTVSLALRNHPSISSKTRDRVKAVAEELNYRPDPAISAIAAQRWSGNSPRRYRTIAFLCHRDGKGKMVQSDWFSGAKQRAEDLGFKLETFFVDDYPSGEAVTRTLYARGIRGILVSPLLNPDSTRAMRIDWSKFTAVCCGVGRVRPPLHVVTEDVFQRTRKVWEVVASLGHKRVGAAIACHHPVAEDDWMRIGASFAAQRVLGMKDSADIPFLTSDVRDEGALIDWFKKYRPSIIVGFSDLTGRILESSGVSIPGEVQLACLIATEGSRWSGAIQSPEQVARASVDVLNTELRDNHWGIPDFPNIVQIQPRWNPGDTLIGGNEAAKKIMNKTLLYDLS